MDPRLREGSLQRVQTMKLNEIRDNKGARQGGVRVGRGIGSGLGKTAAAIVLSPLVGFALALLLTLIVSWIFVRATPYTVDVGFRWLQFVSASLYSLYRAELCKLYALCLSSGLTYNIIALDPSVPVKDPATVKPPK